MREEADSFLCFAYGSNMLTARLRGRTPSARVIATGYVVGRRLTFDKVSSDGSGKCDMESSQEPGSQVHGVLFRIDEAQRAELDECEGLGKGYETEIVSVVTPSGVVQALAYVATNKQTGLQPYDWYKAFVVEGAREHELPAEYIGKIEQVFAKQDLKTSRSKKWWALVKTAEEGRKSL
ncbi:MAG: gamma-glutamylcyclotransferase family protein [Candidatus Eisenbacteria bacterium]